MSATGNDVLLLRMAAATPQTMAFARQLTAHSGLHVVCLVDERNGEVPVGSQEKLALTRPACRALGLHCPADFAWRCGDYGLYLARQRYQEARHIWLVESDVRFRAGGANAFFDRFAGVQGVDLVTTFFGRAGLDWFWNHTVAARNATTFRCLFPVIRVSAEAVDRLLRYRRALSRQPLRRAAWPNDESFVATALANDGSVCRDFNDFGAPLYTEDSFSFFHPHRGEALPPESGHAVMFHPVLFGAEFARKEATLRAMHAPDSRLRLRCRQALHRLNALSAWPR